MAGRPKRTHPGERLIDIVRRRAEASKTRLFRPKYVGLDGQWVFRCSCTKKSKRKMPTQGDARLDAEHHKKICKVKASKQFVYQEIDFSRIVKVVSL